jgi:hypothetical protein
MHLGAVEDLPRRPVPTHRRPVLPVHLLVPLPQSAVAVPVSVHGYPMLLYVSTLYLLKLVCDVFLVCWRFTSYLQRTLMASQMVV